MAKNGAFHVAAESASNDELLAQLDQAWQLALAQQNPTAMGDITWKKCLLLGLVTDKIELKIIVDGPGVSPAEAVEQGITRLVTRRRRDS